MVRLVKGGESQATAVKNLGLSEQTRDNWVKDSEKIQNLLKRSGMHGLMSRKGNGWDNAVTATLFGSLKAERLHGMRFETRRAAMDAVAGWLAFCNRKRLHSTLGYKSPMAVDEIWRRQQNTLAP